MRWSAARLGVCLAVGCVVQGATAQGSADPLYRATGDHERSYKFAEAGGIDSPYRVYVPVAWDGHKRLPMVVILHGSNLNHDAAFDREPAELKGELEREAEKHGFIVVGVEGYRDGSYGNTFPSPLSQYVHFFHGMVPRGAHRPDRPVGDEWVPAAAMPAGPQPPGQGAPARPGQARPASNQAETPEESERNNRLAEQDVLHVIDLVAREYNTDPARLYLMGNSQGAIGTYYLAAAHPELFAAIAPSDGPIDPTYYPFEKTKGLAGAIIVHGEDDSIAPIDDSEFMAFLFRRQGVDAVFDAVAKGGHTDSWYLELPKVFDFFAAHSRR